MHFHTLDEREVPHVAGSNKMLKKHKQLQPLPFQHQNRKKKLNYSRMTTRDKLVLRIALSYEKYNSTKQRLLFSSVAVTAKMKF